MYNEIIRLVSVTESVDDYGDIVSGSVERPVFAELRSIGQSEFYQAQSVGLKPEIKFLIADYLDYRNEKTLKYKDHAEKDEEYTIIRTYRSGNELEIVCKRGVDV